MTCFNKRGFTLLELLVVIGIIALLGSMGFAATQGILVKSRQAKCASNLRQIGVAVIGYTQENAGNFPVSTHGLDVTTYGNAWIYSLAPYLSDVEEVRICPADPKSAERLEAKGTSYIMNSFLTVPKLSPFGEPMGGFTNLNGLSSMTNTPMAFIINFSKGVGVTNDHTHSEAWTNWGRVVEDIQPDAFRLGSERPDRSSGSSNYLFVDGHVENIKAEVIQGWISSGYNFADPASKTKS
ncbi:type II secretion system protein [Phragmitibacter flavus]|nr:prepilin-type N-terminal cleavage/methylation domain-containing protein [Phragmitibacter flavus]